MIRRTAPGLLKSLALPCGAVLAFLSAPCGFPAHAAEWGWPAKFTEASSAELRDLHSRIHATAALETGWAVRDAHFTDDFFDLHMISGALFLEPEIEGYPVGAFFVGEGTVSFTPESRKAKANLDFRFASESLQSERIPHAYFFTLDGTSLVDRLALEGEAEVPFDAQEAYVQSKDALRQLGMRLVHGFLNRLNRADGTAYVLFPPDSIRIASSPEAYLLYSVDPMSRHEVGLEVFGHQEMKVSYLPVLQAEYRHFFWQITSAHSDPARFRPAAAVDAYEIDLEVAPGLINVGELSTVTFSPEAPVSALQFNLTPRLEVTRVSWKGRDDPLPFLQWRFLPDRFDIDEHLLVASNEPLLPGKTYQLEIEASGPLSDPLFHTTYVADEDAWHPLLSDAESASYELRVAVPKRVRAVGAGKLISEEVVEETRRYHFKTSRPHKRSSVYWGRFTSREGKVDELELEVFADQRFENSYSDLKRTTAEVENAIAVFSRILLPLELGQLRVVGIPQGHGRGFEGLILLSQSGMGDMSSAADLFKAHEVAHQWWGNMVQPKYWPEDRWLSEAFADYVAMEYYQIRHENPRKTNEQRLHRWVKPVLEAPREPYKTLNGNPGRKRESEFYPLIDGTDNVYDKGPLVLSMLRYVFVARQGNDRGFWSLLQDFLEQNAYRPVTSLDFIGLTEERMGGRMDWFWDQWLYGTRIPSIRWSHEAQRKGDKWALTVRAEQEDTEFILALPVYVELADGRKAVSPLILTGRTGEREILLPAKPKKVTLNEQFEALVEIKD